MSNCSPKHQDTSPQFVFRRIAHHPTEEEIDAWANTGADPAGFSKKWEIVMNAESCRLPDLAGLEYIHKVLSATHGKEFVWVSAGKHGRAVQREVSLVPLAGGEAVPTQPIGSRSLSPSRLARFVADTERLAKQALESGNRAEYHRLVTEVNGARKYQRETLALGGANRAFPDAASRDADAVRKAIERGITEIRKSSAGIADHLKTNILPAPNGCWFYNGDSDVWDTSNDGLLERDSLAEEIREQREAEKQLPTNGGAVHAYVPLAKPVLDLPRKVQIYIPKCSGFVGLQGAVTALRILENVTGNKSHKPFQISRPAYNYRDAIERLSGEVIDDERCCQEYEQSEGRPVREGDDLEPIDFE